MGLCQYCGKDHGGILQNRHKFCRKCGRVKRGPSPQTLDVSWMNHQHWINRVEAVEHADCLV